MREVASYPSGPKPQADRSLLAPNLHSEKNTIVARERFMAGDARERLAARTEVIESWERCRGFDVGPGTDIAPTIELDAMGALRRLNQELLMAAAGTLAESADMLAGTGSIMLIADASGVVLDSAGDVHTLHAGMDIALARGGDWREAGAGTNGIGTALATSRPMMVHASEHYCEGIRDWSCAGAPIHDPVDGSIAGILGISAKKHESNAQILALSVFAAHGIEKQLVRRAEALRMMLLEVGLDHSQRHGGDGLIAIDARGRIAYLSHLSQSLLRDRYSAALPELRRGMRLIDDPSGTAAGLLPDLPRDWLRPVVTDGALSGHLVVIPGHRGSGRIGRPARATAPKIVAAEVARSPFDCIVGSSAALKIAIDQARQLAALDVPVLIEGETGVGKELFARAIHDRIAAGGGPLVAFNCGAVSKDMIASELFGYAKGAFTGASSEGRIGRFEQADGGTLCLDEIGELQLDLQPYLLRVLEEGMVSRLGENLSRPVKVRVIAMTNRDLRAEVAAGRFRRDLYHRLSIAAIEVPPLRQRDGDLEALIGYFNPRIADRHHRDPVRFTDRAMALMRSHAWPGNVRELRNTVERAILFARDGIADVDSLPRDIVERDPPAAARNVLAIETFKPRTVDERAAIEQAMQLSAGNLSIAAQLLGTSRSTLYRKMAVHDIKRVDILGAQGKTAS